MLLVRGIGRLVVGDGTIASDVALIGDRHGIKWVGGLRVMPPALSSLVSDEINAMGALVTPGLVDAHSHPVYAGNRFAEIAMRSEGADYQQVAQAGGGIASTVHKTRHASRQHLFDNTLRRARRWLAGGTTTLEAKTGYHLTRDGELMDLEILSEVGAQPGVPSISATFLAAHALPAEFEGDADAYIDTIAQWLPQAFERGARHVDVFCDEGYFSVDQSRRLLLQAKAAGLRTRIHADELARTGAAMLAAEVGADSADHLLRITDDDARILGEAGVAAVLCPGTALAMGHTPPMAALRDANVTIGLGSDHNPGTSGLTDMTVVIALAVAALGMSVHDAVQAATRGSATSLGFADRGVVAVDKRTDLVIWSADHEGAFAWSWGLSPLQVILQGKPQPFGAF